jgi:hypothetical protein
MNGRLALSVLPSKMLVSLIFCFTAQYIAIEKHASETQQFGNNALNRNLPVSNGIKQ